MACIAIVLFTNFLVAENPKNNATGKADAMVAKLNKNVILTDSQKVYILKKATDFVTKVQHANTQTDVKEKYNLKEQAFYTYRALLDSVLTKEQKSKLSAIQTEQMNRITNKHKSIK